MGTVAGLDQRGFHITDLLTAVTTGNFTGIARELMQPFGGSRRWEQKVQEASARMRERGEEHGGFGGLAMRALGRLIGRVPMLASPAAILAGEQIFERGSEQARSIVRGGQMTGGGFGEGLAAGTEARRLS